MLKVAIVILAVVALALWVVQQQGKKNEAFLANAKKANGVITAKNARVVRPDQPTRKEYSLNYRFEVDGESFSGNELVEFQDMWQSAQEGQAVEVYYVPGNPAKSHLAAVLERRLGISRAVSN
jgi:hypothetical protein